MVGKNKTASQSSTAKKVENVSEFMQRLEHPLKPEVEALRQIILGANDQIREEIKWNAPSFYVKEHFATFNLHAQEFVQVIFHRGAKAKDDSTGGMDIQDPQGILVWISKDRCAARFYDMSDVISKKVPLAEIVNQWIQRM